MTDEQQEAPAEGQADAGQGDEQSEEHRKAQEAEEARDQAKEKMEELEEGDPPKDLQDWPADEAKYETFGGPEGPHSYAEGPETKLGPPGVRHHEDGSVSVDGEKVDNPDEFKGDPIPGGPTDPNAPALGGEKAEEEGAEKVEDEGGESGDGGESGGEGSGDDSS
jgi:hypothetical protein